MNTRLNLTITFIGIILFFSSCTKEVIITNGELKMEINDLMQVKFSSLEKNIKPFYTNFYPSDELRAEELLIDNFKLVNIQKSKEGNAVVYILKGEFQKDGFNIEKKQIITIPEKFSNMLLFKTFYVNKGNKTLTVNSWGNHKIRIMPLNHDTVMWSFQPSSSNQRKDWILPVKQGFNQKNYLGMNNSDYGGGIPMVNMWRKDGGLAVGLTETTLKMISMPVKWIKYNDYATFGLQYEYSKPIIFSKNDTIRTYDSFVELHTGDFFNPLKQFSNFMQSEKNLKFAKSEPEAFEPVWCAWGYERMFTIKEIINTLPKVKELGFKWVDVDDGYQIAEGDWEVNDRFPGGNNDLRKLTDEIHNYGLKAKLWWAPLAADPCSKLLKEHPEVLLLTEEGIPQYITWWNSFYLSPVNEVTKLYTNNLLHRFLVEWNFDGLKIDGQHLNCCPPDYNPASKLTYPEQAVEKFPTYFENILNVSQQYKPHVVIQICPCGCAVNYFIIPFMNQAVASDPTSSRQIRLKGKAYKAINDQIAYYADHVELSDNGIDFASQIGIGGVVGSKFTYPKDNPFVKGSYLLTPDKEKIYKKWINIYSQKMLSKGNYLNLYDIAYDKPEAHVIQKGDTLFYAFYADKWNGNIELRGLEQNRNYSVCEYTSDSKNTFSVNGSNPVIKTSFKNNYLIQVY